MSRMEFAHKKFEVEEFEYIDAKDEVMITLRVRPIGNQTWDVNRIPLSRASDCLDYCGRLTVKGFRKLALETIEAWS